MTKPATAAEKRHMSKVASLGCIACLLKGWETPGVELHLGDKK